MSSSDTQNDYYQSYVVNEIPSSNEYVKEPKDYEKYSETANGTYETIDTVLCEAEGSGKLKEYAKDIHHLSNEDVTYDRIMRDLFGDEKDGKVTMNVTDAINMWNDLIITCINKADKYMMYNRLPVDTKNLTITCEFVRAFGM